jgi:hypothetical protein
MNLTNAVVLDIETFPNCFTVAMEPLFQDEPKWVWEISHRRDDRRELLQWLQWLAQTQTPMITFNGIHFDYPVIHFLIENNAASVEQIYAKAMSIIESGDKFGHTIWPDKRHIPQIDLFKLYHFDNPAKSTSLKYLQVNMRSETVVDMPVENGTVLTKEQIDELLVPYNNHDVSKTKKFARISHDPIMFRISLIDQFGPDVLNWNDTKIGEQIIIRKLGNDLCYDFSTGRKRPRQTPRTSVALNEIIFPYIQFQNPAFQHVLTTLRAQVLRSEDLYEDSGIKTKGVFTDLKALVGGVEFYFGTGGIHGSLERKRIVATDEWLIRDIDVAGMYPNIIISNKLAPEHLGEAFTQVYSQIPKERKKWQAEKGKKCPEANALKLAANGVYGKSNSPYSPFYDPKLTMQVTINGQLMLAMLVERLCNVPSLTVLYANTDGVTYRVHRDYEPTAAAVAKEWENLTGLELEGVSFKRLWLRDVNNFLAENMDGSLKTKGAYNTPDALNYSQSISEMQPPGWHRDWSALVAQRAAVAHMVHGCDIEQYIRMCTNPFDFMCSVKVRRGDTLLYRGIKQQRVTRYYVSTNGSELMKLAPSLGVEGAYKKANGVSDAEYQRVMAETGGQWDMRVCTKKKSKYEQRSGAICAGYKVSICNDARDFDFSTIDYSWYVHEATKLVI